jgi:hypothetical protein
MAKTRTKPKPIRLHFESTNQVMVVPDDEDRFFTTESEAARACKQVERSRDWSQQWNDFLVHVNRWCEAHKGDIEAGYVTVGDSALNVLLFLRRPDYDFGLEDGIADLDLELAEKFPLCTAEVLQIPNQPHLRAAFQQEVIAVYGDGERASKASTAQSKVS